MDEGTRNPAPHGRLHGRRGVILGVANDHSIAWAIAKALVREGAEVALTYESERVRSRVERLAGELGGHPPLPCDVTSDDEIDRLVRELDRLLGRLDFLVHSVAYAPREALSGRFLDTSREAFRIALDVSAYSLVGLCRAARPLLPPGAAVLTMTYYGAEKVMPQYNVMGVAKAALEAAVRYLAADLGPDGIRVNAISAGPMNTLAARGIAGFSQALKLHAERAPLRRNVEGREIGETAVYLLSDMASAVTGEVVHVDTGFHLTGA
ncbi:MAG: enoyl-ACP reductase [Clostridia bacterium]|nr:enoyl-ACP reductase [Clostridia bacterium]